MPYKNPQMKREHSRSYYLKNREKLLLAGQNARELDKLNGRVRQAAWESNARKRRQALIHSLKDKPCEDCGKSYPPYVMDFDHVRGEKLFSLGRAYHRSVYVDDILSEAAKCDIVCANCHRERTHGKSKHY